jgi:hypothetical protein
MKMLLAGCAMAIFVTGPTLAHATDNAALNAAVGQSVYDVHDLKVGVIRGVTNETGQRSAIISTMKAGAGNQDVLIITSELQPRNGGGWISVLPASAILDMQPYIPGHMLPL